MSQAKHDLLQDRQASLDDFASALGYDPALTGRPLPFVIASDGNRVAWVSDVARAMREPASRVNAALLRLELRRLNKR